MLIVNLLNNQKVKLFLSHLVLFVLTQEHVEQLEQSNDGSNQLKPGRLNPSRLFGAPQAPTFQPKNPLHFMTKGC